MVVALSVALAACGDEDDGYAKKNNEESNGRPRSVGGGGNPRGGADAGSDEDAGQREPGDLDGGEPGELDASGGSDAGGPSADASGPGGDAGRDARADAQPSGPDAGGGACAAPGDGCETLDCCEDATCILEPETGDPICAAQCSAPSECNSECCIEVRDSDLGACVPARYCETPPVPTGGGCDTLVLIAQDGTFLGNAASSPVAANGVCNQASPHGNTTGANSIFNATGVYGSATGAQSAYNSLTSTPPALRCSDTRELVAYVTKNQLVADAPPVDPDALCIVLEGAGF